MLEGLIAVLAPFLAVFAPLINAVTSVLQVLFTVLDWIADLLNVLFGFLRTLWGYLPRPVQVCLSLLMLCGTITLFDAILKTGAAFDRDTVQNFLGSLNVLPDSVPYSNVIEDAVKEIVLAMLSPVFEFANIARGMQNYLTVYYGDYSLYLLDGSKWLQILSIAYITYFAVVYYTAGRLMG